LWLIVPSKITSNQWFCAGGMVIWFGVIFFNGTVGRTRMGALFTGYPIPGFELYVTWITASRGNLQIYNQYKLNLYPIWHNDVLQSSLAN